MQIASGRFSAIAHETTGKAAVVELPTGARKLTLSDFETDPGPDLRLYVSTGDPADGDLGRFRDLGALKGNVGDQQYDLVPARQDRSLFDRRGCGVVPSAWPLRPRRSKRA